MAYIKLSIAEAYETAFIAGSFSVEGHYRELNLK